jgi:malonyl CoA-acyl carrier protein transacylase
MNGALEEVRALFTSVRRRPGCAGFVANGTGALTEEDRIPELLALSLVSTVWWTRCMRTLAALGVSLYVTIGFGKVLCSLLKRTLGEVEVWGSETPRELEKTIARLTR